MTRTKFVLDVAIVFGPLIDVFDQESDRCAGRLAFKYAGKDFDLIRLISLRRMTTAPGTAAIKVALNICCGQLHTGRATVDNAADCRPVAFAKRRYSENSPKRIARHR